MRRAAKRRKKEEISSPKRRHCETEEEKRHARGTSRRPSRARLGFFLLGDEVAGRAVSEGRTKSAEADTAAIMVVVHISSNRYDSLASCGFPLAAVTPPRVAATRAFFPDTRRCEFPPSRRLGSASLFTELCLIKTVCLARRPSPIEACGRITSESISVSVTSGTRSRWVCVRRYEDAVRQTFLFCTRSALFRNRFFPRHLAAFRAFRSSVFSDKRLLFRGVHDTTRDSGARDGRG